MIKREYFYNRLDLSDVEIYSAGRCDCGPGLSWGPGLRNHYLFVYVLSGRGRFTAGTITQELAAGELFLLKPFCKIWYQADAIDPWDYCWVSFQGTLAEKLLSALGGKDVPAPWGRINRADREAFEAKLLALLDASSRGSREGELLGVGFFMQLLSAVIGALKEPRSSAPGFPGGMGVMGQGRKSDTSGLYCEAAKEFISRNFFQDISVSSIAAHLGLNRAYFSTLFKAREGTSPGAYLLQYRMRQARTLLGMDMVSVEAAANSVGYTDAASFSRAYARFFGYPPSRSAGR
jgi:AraC-like DNA-binding protein